ncbi:hypothetical protein [uncultured Parasphingorhabdus sp.]|uniref:hypothetical protein n=1 Tax=uncultured Parasphingorhabdus sp. TaxID=2709694 RepID=UPI002AA63A07|nr:hypothetical protein [uncultured Parasphingorhabdus sp.]
MASCRTSKYGSTRQPFSWASGPNALLSGFRAEYHWQSKIYFTVFKIDSTSQDSYGLLRASLGFISADDKWLMFRDFLNRVEAAKAFAGRERSA